MNKLEIAESFASRLKGLLGRSGIADEEGLLIKECNQIHMFFMRFPIDAVFVNTRYEEKTIYKVIKIISAIKPWRVSPFVCGADAVLEIKSGKSAGSINVGDELEAI